MEVQFNKMNDKQKKYAKWGIDFIIVVLCVFVLTLAYNAGKHNGKVEICQDANMILVDFQGVKECWDEQLYITQKERFNDTFDETFIGGNTSWLT